MGEWKVRGCVEREDVWVPLLMVRGVGAWWVVGGAWMRGARRFVGAATNGKGLECSQPKRRLPNRTAKVAIAPMLSAHHSSLRAFCPHAGAEGATFAPATAKQSTMKTSMLAIRGWSLDASYTF